MSGTDGYEPAKSTGEATLWLRRFHPERLDTWLAEHDPRLRAWINSVRPPGYVYPALRGPAEHRHEPEEI